PPDCGGSRRECGIVDAAASDTGVFTVSSNLSVRAYAPDGFLRSTAAISEGADAQALAIRAVGGAVWVSIIRGCTSGSCEKKTLVFDSTLNQTMSMTGGITDVIALGNRAYAITDLPTDVRVITIADAAH